MKEYPCLTEMGISNPQQIVRYSVSSMNNTDYLLIVYKRPKGSILPVRRTYEFPRIPIKETSKNAGDKHNFILNTNPTFKKALDELDDIVEIRTSRAVITDAMNNELSHIEEEISLHVSSLKSLVEDLKKID